MNTKLIDDVVETVKMDETFKQTSQKLSADENASIEAGVREMAKLIAPLLELVDVLKEDDEMMTLLKTKLSEKFS